MFGKKTRIVPDTLRRPLPGADQIPPFMLGSGAHVGEKLRTHGRQSLHVTRDLGSDRGGLLAGSRTRLQSVAEPRGAGAKVLDHGPAQKTNEEEEEDDEIDRRPEEIGQTRSRVRTVLGHTGRPRTFSATKRAMSCAVSRSC